MFVVLHKGYSKTRIIGLIIAVLFLLAGLFVGYTAYASARLHRQLDSSIYKLQASLGNNGVQSVQNRGCGLAYTEFGPNKKVCGIALSSNIPAKSPNSAYDLLKKYGIIVNNTGRFSSEGSLPKAIVDKDGLTFGYVYYKESETHKVCSIDYDFEIDKSLVRLGFSCDYNTWFSDNF